VSTCPCPGLELRKELRKRKRGARLRQSWSVSYAVLSQGVAIVSGDQILLRLCSSLGPSAAVFLTDVPGVFTRPPTETGAALVPELLVAPDGALRAAGSADGLSSSSPSQQPLVTTSLAHGHDVTGGLAEKLKAAVAVVARCDCPVYVVQAGTVHAADALAGRVPRVGTVLRRDDDPAWQKQPQEQERLAAVRA